MASVAILASAEEKNITNPKPKDFFSSVSSRRTIPEITFPYYENFSIRSSVVSCSLNPLQNKFPGKSYRRSTDDEPSFKLSEITVSAFVASTNYTNP
jgi:hypothetical protein